MPGIESQQAFDLINERFPGSAADGAQARIVFVAEDGRQVTSAGSRAAIDQFVSSAANGPQVAQATSPFATDAVSKDGFTAYATITYKVAANDLTDASKTDLDKAIEQARQTGLTVDAGGSAVSSQPEQGLGEALGIVVAAVVLVITFGSMAAAGLPLLTALLGIAVSLSGITALSSAFGFSSSVGQLAMRGAVDRLLPVTRQWGDEALTAHRAFHQALYRASHNDVLIRLLDDLWDKSDRYRRLGLELPPGDEPRTRDLQEHHRLVSLVVDGRAAEAAQLMRDHITHSLTATAISALEDREGARTV
ncbi:MMPL family transporter [Streptomyces malaysiensis]|uniref:MMPL family transporter n=1 Tax=Streptomyces malaysiensis TaxID=92644 RepID=UPI002B2F2C13|nr:MMPL family transporter [Streptomyces malaysiensis]